MSTRLVEAFRAVNFREVRMAVLVHWSGPELRRRRRANSMPRQTDRRTRYRNGQQVACCWPPEMSEQCPTVIVTAPLSIAGRGPDGRDEMEIQPTVEAYDQLVDEVTQDEPRASAIEWLVTAGMCVAAVLAIWLAVEESEPIFFVLGAGSAALGVSEFSPSLHRRGNVPR